jgi:hypothetical protein
MTTNSSEDRQPAGEWCWCRYLPEGQDPHDCAEHTGHPHQHDGAHVHPYDTPVPIPAAAREQIARAIEAAAGLDDLDADEREDIELDDEQQYAQQAAGLVWAWPVTDQRWGVFVSRNGEEPAERHRWDGDTLVPIQSQRAAETRAAETRGLHPDWTVTVRQTPDPLPGTWRETFAAYLPGQQP